MLNVYICEDNKAESDNLIESLKKYGKQKNIEFNIRLFDRGIDFLNSYSSNCDIVFMDIDMPSFNGFQVAKRLRQIDSQVILVFVTNLAQYAIKGYEFDASDYILKPLKFPSFELKMNKIILQCAKRYVHEIQIKTSNGEIRLSSSQIIYVEINSHSIVYHTEIGDYNAYGTMKRVEEQLGSKEFAKCNSGYLVNLRHVSKIDGNKVFLGPYELLISRPKRKAFIERLHAYYGHMGSD